MSVSALDSKKMQREFLDVYQRLIDYCILIAARSFDQGLWSRRRDFGDAVSTSSEKLDSDFPGVFQNNGDGEKSASPLQDSINGRRSKEDEMVVTV